MIDVSYCALDEQTLTLLLRAVRANCYLRVLKIEGNNLTGKGTFILSEFCSFSILGWRIIMEARLLPVHSSLPCDSQLGGGKAKLLLIVGLCCSCFSLYAQLV